MEEAMTEFEDIEEQTEYSEENFDASGQLPDEEDFAEVQTDDGASDIDEPKDAQVPEAETTQDEETQEIDEVTSDESEIVAFAEDEPRDEVAEEEILPGEVPDSIVGESPDEEEDESESEEDTEQSEEQAEVTIETVIEAVLFASDESLTAQRLANIAETSVKQVREHIKILNESYRASNRSFRIERIAGGYQMLTLGGYNVWLKKLLRVRSETKLSPAALETLAIIAYKQPLIRADIESIRGVAAGEMIRSLMYKGMVKIVGRAEVLGRPMLYGTTKKFLEIFGLNTLKDLPKVEELKKPPS